MSYSQIGREGNLGPWVSEIRYASTAAREFDADSLGVTWDGRAYNRYGAPLSIELGGGYGGDDDGLGFNILKAIGGAVKSVVTHAIPIVGPAIGAGLDAFKKRTTGAAIQAVASNPTVQAAAVSAAQDEASAGFQKAAPYVIAGLAAYLFLSRRRR